MSEDQNRPHPNSPAGGGGPGGFRVAGPLGTGSNEFGTALAEPGVMNVRVPVEMAGHPGWLAVNPHTANPVLAAQSASTWDDLQHWAERILGPTSFNLGVCCGMVENLATGVASLLNLLKTFVLEGIYQEIHHPPPWWETTLVEQYMLARLWAFAIGEVRLEEAHRQCVALLGELKRVVTEPGKFFSQLGKGIVAEYEDKWKHFNEEMRRGTLGGDFQAGRITGQVLLDVIMLLLAVYGAAELAAKVAAEIPELLNLVKGLRGAETALKMKTPISVGEAAADGADEFGGTSPKTEAPKVERPVAKPLSSPQAVRDWAKKFPRKPTPTSGLPQDVYEIAQTGTENTQIEGGGAKIWADGVRDSDGYLLDAKYVGKADSSPFVNDSKVPDFIRQKIRAKIKDEMERYAAVINDPATPVQGLEVITNEPRAVPYFEELMKESDVPGRVVVKQ